jgi:hypothetical protein
MSLVCIKATFECDGCGTQFKVDMDAAHMRPKGWCLMDEAVDCLRGCVANTVVHDLHLCAECHDIAAKIGPEDEGYAPKDQIVRALASHYDAMNRVVRS